MKILTMMWNNLRRGYQTLVFPARPEISSRFRGRVEFDPELCIGCAICRFRCTSRAIDFKAGKGEFTWSYNPGQCTFCGRCVEGCKEGALKQEEACPPLYFKQGELANSYTVARRKPAAKPPVTAAAQPPSEAPGGVQ
jgi:formate hydrogenlyase subunit 6/NADH:ubiquinone oxidoreductase subunit I